MKIPGPPNPVHTNGNHKAPQNTSGALSAPRLGQSTRTTFDVDNKQHKGRALAYALFRFHIGNVPITRYIILLLVVGIIAWSVGVLPGRWIGATACTIMLILVLVERARLRKRDFVRFTPAVQMERSHSTPLTTQDKVAVYATGLFSVEGKYQRFTWLPGFYRTFATGEHAVMCLVRPRKFLGMARWPEEDIGMWYIFFMPYQVRSINAGELQFATHHPYAVAVDYEVTLPSDSRFRSDSTVTETIYLVVSSPNERARLLADLQTNVSPPHTPATARMRATSSSSRNP